MKYLIVSDIHGSLPALEQVLRVYEEEHCEMMLILGDILNYGPRNRIPEGIDPKGIADRLNAMKENIVAVRGNCDSEVDQMLLQFPVLSTYAVVVDNGRRLFLTDMCLTRRTCLPANTTFSSMATRTCGSLNRTPADRWCATQAP